MTLDFDFTMVIVIIKCFDDTYNITNVTFFKNYRYQYIKTL